MKGVYYSTPRSIIICKEFGVSPYLFNPWSQYENISRRSPHEMMCRANVSVSKDLKFILGGQW